MTKPFFSIVTVTLNHLSGLKNTYDSLLAQNFSDYEWIVVDGSSTDGTIEYLDQTQAIYISEPDNGIYDAMNKAIAKASGQYIWFMNAGDLFADIDVLSDVLKFSDADFIYGDALENERYKKARSHRSIECGMFTHHQAMIYKAELLKPLKYDLHYQIASDYDLTFRFLNHAKKVRYISKPLCVFEQGGISQTNVVKGRKEQFMIRKNNNIGSLKNIFIYAMQTAAYQLRRFFPAFYWRIKKK